MRTLASLAVTVVTIALVVMVVELVGHEAGHLFSKVTQGLTS